MARKSRINHGEEKVRLVSAGIGLVVGVLVIGLLSTLLPPEGWWANMLVDRQSERYPFTIQNLMWLVFFLSLSELFVRRQTALHESVQLRHGFLPEDDQTVLQKSDLAVIFAGVKASNDSYFLPRLIKRVILQVQLSNSGEQASSLLDSSLELFMHEIDLRYNMLRYIMWFIPTLGFIGTVVGIADALSYAGSFSEDNPVIPMNVLTAKLGVAFYTTLLALIMAGVIVFLTHIIQAREERALNSSGQYCMDNLINRLYLR